jgi:hypothetical protein
VIPQFPPSAVLTAMPVSVPVATLVFDLVFKPRSVLVPFPPPPPTRALLPGLDTGPPQAKKAAAIKTAAPSSHSQLIRLSNRSLVIVTSLNCVR